MAKTILGLDLRVCAVKVVEIRYGKEGARIINWGMSEVPYGLVDKHPEKESIKQKHHCVNKKGIAIASRKSRLNINFLPVPN